MYQETKVSNPIIKVIHRCKIIDGHWNYLFSVNGKSAGLSISKIRNNDDGKSYFNVWNGDKCKSIAGLKATRVFLENHTVKRTYNDGSFGYGFKL